MSLLDTLRKLGIIRFGTKTATYRNATERPVEFMVDNINNAEKEAINLNAPAQSASALSATPAGAAAGRCGKCGAVLPSGAKFCGSCGAPQPAPSAGDSCAQCGAALKPGAKFCGSCGAPAAGGASSSAPAVSPKATSRMKGCLIGGLIGFALLVVLMIVLAIIGTQTELPKQAADSKVPPAEMPPKMPTASQPATPAATPAAAPASAPMVSPAIKETPPSVVAPPVTPPQTPPPAAAPIPAPSVAAGDSSTPVVRALPAMPPSPPVEPPAVTAAVKYDRYANPKFGFVTELPAHWESEVRDNTHLFSGPKGSEDNNVTINFQFVAMNVPGQVAQQKRDALEQWQRMEGFRLIEDNVYNLRDQYPTGFLHVLYKTPGNDTPWEQVQVIVERQPHYYYHIGYTAPQPLFEKYYPHMKRLIQTLLFTPLPQ